ncbi:MAG: flippase-like domain-containing protein [Planctomycetes bacterium]|nr:flippase-like domain-containing protein [Planctomycetota bacterium]
MKERCRGLSSRWAESGWIRPVYNALKYVLFCVVIVCVGRILFRRLADVPWQENRPSFLFLSLGLICAVVSRGLSIAAYRNMLQLFRCSLSWKKLAPAAWIAPLGKYVPGKVASALGAVWMLRRNSVRMTVATSVVTMNQILTLAVGVIAAVPLAILNSPPESMAGRGFIWLLLPLLAIIGLHPSVLVPILNLGLKQIGPSRIEAGAGGRSYWAAVGIHACQHALAGVALWAVWRSVESIPFSTALLCVSASALAGVIGYMAFFAPGGLGVREGLLLFLLGPESRSGAIVIVVVAVRIVWTVAELLLAFAAAMMRRLGRESGSNHTNDGADRSEPPGSSPASP